MKINFGIKSLFIIIFFLNSCEDMEKDIEFDFYYILLNEGDGSFEEVKEAFIAKNYPFLKGYTKMLTSSIEKDTVHFDVNDYYKSVLEHDFSKRINEFRSETLSFLEEIEQDLIDGRLIDEADEQEYLYYAFQKERHVLYRDSWFVNRLGIRFTDGFTDLLQNKSIFIYSIYNFKYDNILISHPFPYSEYGCADYKELSPENALLFLDELAKIEVGSGTNTDKEMSYMKKILSEAINTKSSLYLAKVVN